MLSTNENKNYINKNYNHHDVEEIVSRQDQLLADFAMDSFNELVALCKNKKIDHKAIIRLAWDIVEMSANVPCCCGDNQVHDMSNRVCKVIKELAAVEDYKKIDSNSFAKATNFIAQSSTKFLVSL